ncbi:Nucleolar protein 56 [Smittium mucronatum]|uniref:Nucleolar protein 56 n=1 Tax=Smittium mucronatum TaxID=133383 RepID=A0A1R0H4V4_9FUNG|nr:Nucleolar protein 56 [Smittium mucronatum]
MSATHILFETASGYGLFEVIQAEEIGGKLAEVQKSVTDLAKFGRYIKLKSFLPFKNAADALENINDVSEGVCSESLKSFLEVNLGVTDKDTNTLGVGDRILAGSIKSETGIMCVNNDLTNELIRGIRFHEDKLLKGLSQGDLEKAQLGLGHAYSRAKVKFNVNRSDNMIIQAIALLDQLDKDVNTFAMRTREWYSWHFPELAKIVSDNVQYAKLCSAIRNKGTLSESMLDALTEVTEDEAVSKNIIEAAKSSMGTDISDIDMINIESFASRVVSLANYRKELYDYLVGKMNIVAPNLAALIGDMVGARLIAHAGSLTNLSKYPASTVQILGAEKALFRALKTKGNTPKYGLIYHSSFIGRAGIKNKGRISRFLANKASIASRIDCYSDNPTNKFGQALHQQVENRLNFYENGSVPTKNSDVMAQAILDAANEEVILDDTEVSEPSAKKESSSKKSKSAEEKTPKKSKSKTDTEETPKKSKKTKSSETPKSADADEASQQMDIDETPKKKKSKKSEGDDDMTTPKKSKKNKGEATPDAPKSSSKKDKKSKKSKKD